MDKKVGTFFRLAISQVFVAADEHRLARAFIRVAKGAATLGKKRETFGVANFPSKNLLANALLIR